MASSQESEPQATLPCLAWVWSNNSNVHVAKDRSWFGNNYVPVDTFVVPPLGGQAKVVGIGTVDLPTKASPRQSGPDSHSTLRLEQVLHVPGSVCNIIGQPILDDYGVVTGGLGDGSTGSITKASDGSPVAFFKPFDDARFFEVQLSEPPIGPQVGPSPFEPSGRYWIRFEWPDSERVKFANLQVSGQTAGTDTTSLSSTERAWLKKHFGGEFKFLMQYGLSIYKDEDREEGRAIMRAMMANDE